MSQKSHKGSWKPPIILKSTNYQQNENSAFTNKKREIADDVNLRNNVNAQIRSYFFWHLLSDSLRKSPNV